LVLKAEFDESRHNIPEASVIRPALKHDAIYTIESGAQFPKGLCKSDCSSYNKRYFNNPVFEVFNK
jgi:hypothetical protein